MIANIDDPRPLIRKKARALGFDACGFAAVDAALGWRAGGWPNS